MPKPTDPIKHAFMFTDDIIFVQKVVIFHPDDNNKFLAMKRPADAFTRPDSWDLVGGCVLYGKLHEESLLKEIKEESNLETEVPEIVRLETRYDDNKKIYRIITGFFCKAKSSDVKISNEHTEFRWLTQKEFIELNSAEFLVDLVNIAFKKVIIDKNKS